ncbi:hypothetical protein MHZ90_16155 [Pantoea sp. ACRSH]|uniref:hypothetical protein n=1 Tax=unclassified Pantoea TaxID=2630326 RepID=UPI001EF58E89|nr:MULTISPECIES: hypothetical protein [unclassified Pantoea]MCG7367649.1 hypothetical protein [Pantoea sp. ACRSH]MCG7398159.1 hypothetical protein [Pantoea sp. ACRSC]
MLRPALFVSLVSLVYSWTYIYCSLFPNLLDYKSEIIKPVANLIFAVFGIVLVLKSRKKIFVSKSDNEINFALAFVPLVIAAIDPFATYLRSDSGKKLLIEHFLGISALGWGLLCAIILFAVVIVGIRFSK